jgi:hypothetical protein
MQKVIKLQRCIDISDQDFPSPIKANGTPKQKIIQRSTKSAKQLRKSESAIKKSKLRPRGFRNLTYLQDKDKPNVKDSPVLNKKSPKERASTSAEVLKQKIKKVLKHGHISREKRDKLKINQQKGKTFEKHNFRKFVSHRVKRRVGFSNLKSRPKSPNMRETHSSSMKKNIREKNRSSSFKKRHTIGLRSRKFKQPYGSNALSRSKHYKTAIDLHKEKSKVNISQEKPKKKKRFTLESKLKRPGALDLERKNLGNLSLKNFKRISLKNSMKNLIGNISKEKKSEEFRKDDKLLRLSTNTRFVEHSVKYKLKNRDKEKTIQGMGTRLSQSQLRRKSKLKKFLENSRKNITYSNTKSFVRPSSKGKSQNIETAIRGSRTLIPSENVRKSFKKFKEKYGKQLKSRIKKERSEKMFRKTKDLFVNVPSEKESSSGSPIRNKESIEEMKKTINQLQEQLKIANQRAEVFFPYNFF